MYVLFCLVPLTEVHNQIKNAHVNNFKLFYNLSVKRETQLSGANFTDNILYHRNTYHISFHFFNILYIDEVKLKYNPTWHFLKTDCIQINENHTSASSDRHITSIHNVFRKRKIAIIY